MGAAIGTGIESLTKTFFNLAESVIHIFGGADPNNVPASQVEQAFESAADNIQALYKAGMITQAQRLAGQQNLLANGTQTFQRIIGQGGDVTPFQKGLVNMTNVINAEMRANPPVSGNQTLSLAAAHALYITTGNWYPGSLAKGAQLTDAFVNDLLSNPLTQMSGFLGEIGNEVTALFGGTPANPGSYQASVAAGGSNHLLIVGGIIALLWKFGKKIF